MVKNKENNKELKAEKAKSSRKSRSGLPQVNLLDALSYVKKAYESLGNDLTSFSGMAKAMGMKEGYAIKAFGELSQEYGLIEKEGNGWRISDLGRRTSRDEKNAVLEVLEKSQILSKLYYSLKDKKYQRDYVEDFIRREFPKISISLVTQRFLEAAEYINGLGEEDNSPKKIEEKSVGKISFFNILKLYYALSPASKDEIESLVDKVVEEIKNTNDDTLISISERMHKNKDNPLILKEFFESLTEIMSKKYSGFSLGLENKKKDNLTK